MKHFIIAAEIYLAGGCFWGTEHFLKQIRGVESTQVGYANSIITNPTYQQVCSGETNAAETVKVIYDPKTIDLSLLLELYFKTIDPTSLTNKGMIVVRNIGQGFTIQIRMMFLLSIRLFRLWQTNIKLPLQ